MKNLVMACATLVLLVQLLLIPAPVSAATTWGTDVRLTNSAGQSLYPMVAVSGSIVHVAWQDHRDGYDQVYYKRSLDNGATWGPDVRLTTSTWSAQRPAIAVSGSTVNIVWSDNRITSIWQIYYMRSLDNGATWGAETPLTATATPNFAPRVAASGNNVYLVWQGQPTGWPLIYFVKSIDAGVTWSVPMALTPNNVGYNSPDIAIVGNTLHVAYEGDISTSIYYRRSSDAGASWDTAISLTAIGLNRYYPSLAVSGQYVYVFWQDNTFANYEIFYARSTGGGMAGTWGLATRLTNATGTSEAPRAAAEQSNVHVAWDDQRDGPYNIFYNNSTDNGGTWSTDAKLTSNASATYFPDLAAAAGQLHLVWSDSRNAGDFEIYYRHGTTPVENVASGSVNTDQGRVTFAASAGSLTGLKHLNPGEFPCGVSGYFFPFGMFAFNVTNLTSGGSVNVTITFPSPVALNAKYYKCQNGTIVDCTSLVTRPDVNTLILRLTDGGLGDADGRANGTIVDPGGPALSLNPSGVTSHGGYLPAPPQGPVSLPNISVKSAKLSAAKVAPGTPVTVTADIANTGAVNGSTRIQLYVNGQADSTQGVTVTSGSNSPVAFTVSRNEPGTYSVYVGGVNAGSFTVDTFADSGWIIFGVSALFLFTFIAAITVYRRSRR
jgi:hypothetical protein